MCYDITLITMNGLLLDVINFAPEPGLAIVADRESHDTMDIKKNAETT